MKKIVFRFDVDTHKCLAQGVPNLVKIAGDEDVSFTFFINTGKSIDRFLSIKKMLLNNSSNASSLSALHKLGLKDYAKAMLINPDVLDYFPRAISLIIQDKHEIGLHGGKNHQQWHEEAHLWPKDKFNDEVLWGIQKLKKIESNIDITGFASPGWNSNTNLLNVLKDNNFKYIADKHGVKCKTISNNKGLKHLPTNILGEPGGVGYLEYCASLNMSDNEIIKDFELRLDDIGNIAIMYDHPYYAGVQKLSLLRKLIDLAKNKGYKFVTFKQLTKT